MKNHILAICSALMMGALSLFPTSVEEQLSAIQSDDIRRVVSLLIDVLESIDTTDATTLEHVEECVAKDLKAGNINPAFDGYLQALDSYNNEHQEAPLAASYDCIAYIVVLYCEEEFHRIELLRCVRDEVIAFCKSELLGDPIEQMLDNKNLYVHEKLSNAFWENPERFPTLKQYVHTYYIGYHVTRTAKFDRFITAGLEKHLDGYSPIKIRLCNEGK